MLKPCRGLFLRTLSFQIRRVKSGWMWRREAGTKWEWCWARRGVQLWSKGEKRGLQGKKRGKLIVKQWARIKGMRREEGEKWIDVLGRQLWVKSSETKKVKVIASFKGKLGWDFGRQLWRVGRENSTNMSWGTELWVRNVLSYHLLHKTPITHNV